jgi:plasmid maintenance system antidote protein VapI
LVGRALNLAGYNKNDASELTAARRQLSRTALTALSNALHVSIEQLSRPLTNDEQREWRFYRASASNPADVWQLARNAWLARALTDKKAAELIGYSPKRLSKDINTRRPMTFSTAARLSTALNIADGPEAFLPVPTNNDRDAS